MGDAKLKGQNYEERRNHRLNQMVEEAEVLATFRVVDGKVHMSTLARDNPADETSPAVAFVQFLIANWQELCGQALSLQATAITGEADQFPEAAGGIVVLDSRGRDAKVDHAPVILGANGGVLTSDRAANPTIELPASAKETL